MPVARFEERGIIHWTKIPQVRDMQITHISNHYIKHVSEKPLQVEKDGHKATLHNVVNGDSSSLVGYK